MSPPASRSNHHPFAASAQPDAAVVEATPSAEEEAQQLTERKRAQRRQQTGRRWRRALLYVALALLLVYAFFPTFWLLSTSIKPQLEAFQNPPTWWPRQITFYSYQILPQDQQGFVQYFKNSLIVSLATTLLSLFASTPAGSMRSRFPCSV